MSSIPVGWIAFCVILIFLALHGRQLLDAVFLWWERGKSLEVYRNIVQSQSRSIDELTREMAHGTECLKRGKEEFESILKGYKEDVECALGTAKRAIAQSEAFSKSLARMNGFVEFAREAAPDLVEGWKALPDAEKDEYVLRASR